jgi:hypothetical protein
MTTRILSTILFALLIASPGCGDAADEGTDAPAPLPAAAECIDNDGDGLGEGCLAGPDCDDSNPGECEPSEPEGCDEGATRECKVWLKNNGKVKNCFVGVQVCSGGAWGECGSEA